MATLQERVAERYPDLLPLLRDPEVGRLLRQAVDPNKPLSQGSFMSKLRATRWFRSQSEASRRWWVTSRMDPGEANLQRATYGASLQQVSEGMGLGLNSAQVRFITEGALQRGLAPDDPRLKAELVAFARKSGGFAKLGAGTIKTTQRDIRNRGVSQWFREPPLAETEKWAADIFLGRKTIEDFDAASAYTASKRFPHMAAQIKAGQTVAEITGPAVEAFAREMDWDPNGLMAKMHTNPGFAGLLGIKDPKTGEMRLPTEHDAQVMARKRADWWQTTGGKEADAGMARTLLNAFGIRKG